MKHRIRFVIFTLLGAVVSSGATAYDGLQADFQTCTRGDSKTRAKAMVDACSRLIANAKVENELVGMFYALRASVNTDKKANCKDAKKAVALIGNPGLRVDAKRLERTNC